MGRPSSTMHAGRVGELFKGIPKGAPHQPGRSNSKKILCASKYPAVQGGTGNGTGYKNNQYPSRPGKPGCHLKNNRYVCGGEHLIVSLLCFLFVTLTSALLCLSLTDHFVLRLSCVLFFPVIFSDLCDSWRGTIKQPD